MFRLNLKLGATALMAGLCLATPCSLKAQASAPSPQANVQPSITPFPSPKPPPFPLSAAPGLLPDADKAPAPPAYLKQTIPDIYSATPVLKCPSVDSRSWRTWQDVGKTMRNAPTCSMYQNWRQETDPKLQPATVAIAHDHDKLIVYAELVDNDIFNSQKKDGEPLYLRGDELEVLLIGEKEQEYIEHQISPDNYILQLQYPNRHTMYEIDAETIPDWEIRFAGHIPIQSQTLVQPELKLWRVLVIMPLAKISPNMKGKNGEKWRFSFARVDTTQGERRATLSATSAYEPHPWRWAPHTYPNFHDIYSWGSFTLVP